MRFSKKSLVALVAVLAFAGSAHAQPAPLDFEHEIVNGDWKGLAKKLKAHVDLSKCPPDLRWYVEQNIAYLERGAKPARPGSEIILIRGAAQDHPYHANPQLAGGDLFMLPNTIRYQHATWDKRLDRIDGYFESATTDQGGDGTKQYDLDKIMTNHAIASQKSVLISTATQPAQMFGPPFYIIKIAPERAIFNYDGLSGEHEVLVPFWILPHEIVAVAQTYQEALDNPLYKNSKLAKVEMNSDGGWGGGFGDDKDNWKKIEANIRAGKKNILAGVKMPPAPTATLNSKFDEGRDVGPDATADEVARFETKVKNHNGSVERVPAGDSRLPADTQGKTGIDENGRAVVFLPEGTVKKFALIDELTHVLQIEREAATNGVDAVKRLFSDAASGVSSAVEKLRGWELAAKKMVLSTLGQDDPARSTVERSVASLEKPAGSMTDAAKLTALRANEGIEAPKALGQRTGFMERLDVDERTRDLER